MLRPGTMRLGDLATLLSADLVGDPDVAIERIAPIETAKPGDLTFLSNPRYARFLGTTRASAVIVARKGTMEPPARGESMCLLRVDDPYIALATVAARFETTDDPDPVGVHRTAVVSPTATIGEGAAIGPGAVIEAGASVGARTRIRANVVVGTDAVVGEDATIFPGVVIGARCRVGNRARLLANCVIGAEGFGHAPRKDGSYLKVPQIGITVLEDDVEVGSCSTIDRATLGETRIRRGVKIDKHVQIAHNCDVGEHTVIAALTGIAGSTRIGARCVLAAQVGVAGHIEIPERTTCLARTTVIRTFKQPGLTISGEPARLHRDRMRMDAERRHAGELRKEVARLRKDLDSLRSRIPGD